MIHIHISARLQRAIALGEMIGHTPHILVGVDVLRSLRGQPTGYNRLTSW